MMNIQQVKHDFDNNVLIGRETMRGLIDWALTMQAATAKAMAGCPNDTSDAAEVLNALEDMAKERSNPHLYDLNATIDAQIANVEAMRDKRADRRVASMPVEFDRRGTAGERRGAVVARKSAGQPLREQFHSQVAYDRAYDRWAERQS